MAQHTKEVEAGRRFEFGKNWQRFLRVLDDERITEAERSLKEMLETEHLSGKSFLDIGSGSGLFSLAAMRLGASRVHSIDYDPQSLACTQELKRRYFPEAKCWTIEEGSALDSAYLADIGQFDIVYSWGVLHHTGNMWKALGNVVPLVPSGGRLFIAIYNDQGRTSRRWTRLKSIYNRLPKGLKFLVLWPAFFRLRAPTVVRDSLLGHPLRSWNNYHRGRGMSPWRDVVDWVGGFPFEVAQPEKVFEFYKKRGFKLTNLTTCAGGHGCNQFVFTKCAE